MDYPHDNNGINYSYGSWKTTSVTLLTQNDLSSPINYKECKYDKYHLFNMGKRHSQCGVLIINVLEIKVYTELLNMSNINAKYEITLCFSF